MISITMSIDISTTTTLAKVIWHSKGGLAEWMDLLDSLFWTFSEMFSREPIGERYAIALSHSARLSARG